MQGRGSATWRAYAKAHGLPSFHGSVYRACAFEVALSKLMVRPEFRRSSKRMGPD